MSAHFAAFSFVDRIVTLQPAKSARGLYAVPATIRSFPVALVAESIGQLAAWVAMAHIDFRGRPVAGLAGEVRFLGEVRPGQQLELGVELESCDDEAVAYRGWATVGGSRVLELNDCVGPMLPLVDFDDEEAVRDRFALLCGAGASPGRFGGVPHAELTVLERSAGEWLRAEMRIPAAAPFFADHFPRRPVFPGTLLLDAQIGLGLELAREAARQHGAGKLAPVRASSVKIRSFILPGQKIEIKAELKSFAGAIAKMGITARGDSKQLSTARLEIAAQGKA
jgi:3-hydroxymyristoyl/3-hydroxydecanoyl-(acyl carrier protein) dehydratase